MDGLYEKRIFKLFLPTKSCLVFGVPNENDFNDFKLPMKSDYVNITAVMNPALQVHDIILYIDEDLPVIRWEKSEETFSIRSSHLIIGDESVKHTWTPADSDSIRKQTYAHTCVNHRLSQGGDVFSCIFGNWDWHVYFGYNAAGHISQISIPFEKDHSWYNHHLDTQEEFKELNQALLNESIVAHFISMNLEDIQSGNANPMFTFTTPKEAFTFAYYTDWKTTKLHLKHIQWGDFRFGEAEVEEWCKRNQIQEPEFLTKRYQKYIEEYRAAQKKEPKI